MHFDMSPLSRKHLSGRARRLIGTCPVLVERVAHLVMDRMQPTVGLAYESGGDDRERPHDFAARMRKAWELRDVQSDIADQLRDSGQAGRPSESG